ncbi:FAD-dependent oxidoreductase [Ruegeria sp. 2205SS24-7]|uniref:NAD(P)/FAD-dependent oxidoreductase n=1 Tax=Ruegeria discodermiae TaxID=3064389 RepID=UPI002740A7B0|nr:FAD-dependent oxidoreductase [Ruegeria sp. 2205SS24-7]MDP5218406.1 FAD-dependent oxidoreductase [Ruegeria sp. 2205SS24-7]
MASIDITIRGAGIFGLSIAWVCARRGAKVQVVDPNGPGAGSSGGLVGALAPHVPENWNAKKAFQFDSLMLAEPFWRDVEATGGVSPGYARLGRLQPILDDKALQLARAREVSVRSLWQGAADWSVRPVAEVGNWAPASPAGYVIHDTLTARMHPRRACAALSAALTALGAQIVSEAADAGQVLHATGVYDLAELSRAFGKTVGNGVKGQAALLRFNAGEVPQIFADAVHIVPHADGTVAIGSTSERDFSDPNKIDSALDDVLDRATRALPVLHGAEVIERWAGLRPRARSRAPMLGDHPLHPGQFIANGGFKIGFGMAPKIAQVMADLMLDRKDDIPEDFRPEKSL